MSGFCSKGRSSSSCRRSCRFRCRTSSSSSTTRRRMTHTWTPARAGRAVGGHRDHRTRWPSRGCRANRSRSRSPWTPTTRSPTGAPPTAAIAEVSGVYSRLAALEMLLYPTGPGSRRAARRRSAAAAAAFSGGVSDDDQATRCRIRSCRWCCSSGVRGASCRSGSPTLTITEQLYDTAPQPHPRRGAAFAAGADARRAAAAACRPTRAGEPRHRRLRLHARPAPGAGRRKPGQRRRIDHRDDPALAREP